MAEPSKKSAIGAVIVGILGNCLIPFLGNFVVSYKRQTAYLLAGLAIAAVFLFTSDRDVLFTHVYIKESSFVVALIMLALFVIASIIVYRERYALRISPSKLIAVLPLIVLYEFVLPGFVPQVNLMATNSLAPYIRAGDIIVYAPVDKPTPGLSVIERTDGGVSAGYVLAEAGDTIGEINDRPVICKGAGDERDCADVSDVCDYLRGGADPVEGPLTSATALGKDQVVLANALTVPDVAYLSLITRDVAKLYELTRTFSTEKVFSLGTPAPRDYCAPG